MEDIKSDKDNREIIKISTMKKLLKLFNCIIDFDNENRESFSDVVDEFEMGERTIIIQQCDVCKTVIDNIKKCFSKGEC